MRFLDINFFGSGDPQTEIDPLTGLGTTVPAKQSVIKKFLVEIVLAVVAIGLFIYSRPKNNREKQTRKPFMYGSIGVAGLAAFKVYKKVKG